jgi:DNA-directed RNA polymerase subunit RPC12/RpoP
MPESVMLQCAKCQSHNLVRSRSRSQWERWRKRITGTRPYRCRACGWRGWRADEPLATAAAAAASTAVDPPNLKGTRLAREDGRFALDLKKLDEFDQASRKRDTP